jgi:hypothetical protein
VLAATSEATKEMEFTRLLDFVIGHVLEAFLNDFF